MMIQKRKCFKKNNSYSALGSKCSDGDEAVVAKINKSSFKGTGDSHGSHKARLLKSVHVDDNLSQEVKQLNDLILEFADTFALEQSELSSTDVVTHIIDTGDSGPIK